MLGIERKEERAKNKEWLEGLDGFIIMIYDRDGTELFKTSDTSDRWDGTYNGKIVATGTYFYVIQSFDTGEIRRGVLNVLKQ